MKLNISRNSGTDFKLIFCLFIVGFVWGTTYLGIRVSVETIPPWIVVSIRQTIASIVLLSVLIYKRQLTWIGWDNFKIQLIPSLLMIVIANGFTTIAEQTLPSSLTAILSSMSPMVIFIGSIMMGLQKPSFKGFLGLIIGFLGVAFIFRDGLEAILDPNYGIGILFLSIAILAWSAGVIYSKIKIQRTDVIALNLFYQFLISAVIQIILAFIFSNNVNVNDWSARSILATIYLAFFGSVLTFFCYHYALKRITTIQISILSYINTIIAIFCGWLFLGEIITLEIILATVMIIFGVFIINYKNKN
ncbi:MAG: DMT family transporter [Flavobacterium sp.]